MLNFISKEELKISKEFEKKDILKKNIFKASKGNT